MLPNSDITGLMCLLARDVVTEALSRPPPPSTYWYRPRDNISDDDRPTVVSDNQGPESYAQRRSFDKDRTRCFSCAISGREISIKFSARAFVSSTALQFQCWPTFETTCNKDPFSTFNPLAISKNGGWTLNERTTRVVESIALVEKE